MTNFDATNNKFVMEIKVKFVEYSDRCQDKFDSNHIQEILKELRHVTNYE